MLGNAHRRSTTPAWRATCAACLALAACEDPETVSSIPALATVTGTVIVQRPLTSEGCVSADAVGPIMLFLFSADDPPPPAGSGRPVSFELVPRQAFLLEDGSVPQGGLLRADYTFSNVPVGDYLVSGFMDADDDFNPLLDELAQATAGDIVGGFVDEGANLRVLSVTEPRVYEQVVVTLGRSLPVERPVFTPGPLVPADDGALDLRLTARSLPALGMDPACSVFLVAPSALDADGRPFDADGDGQLEVYPQVVLTKLEPEPDGGQVIVRAAVRTATIAAQLPSAPGGVPAPQLDVRVPRISILLRPGEPPTAQPGLPPGAYAVSVVSVTGQTWTVPNALPQLFPSGAEDQGIPVTVPEGL